MSFILDNPKDNSITITNEDLDNPLLYTIFVLGDSGVFAAVNGYPDTATESIDANSSISINLEDDGIYQLITDNIYYFFLNSDLRACEKVFLEKILCEECSCSNDLKNINRLIKFDTLKERFYYIANKYIQDQSVVDLMSPENAEVLYWSEILKQLTKICTNCHINSKNCGCSH